MTMNINHEYVARSVNQHALANPIVKSLTEKISLVNSEVAKLVAKLDYQTDIGNTSKVDPDTIQKLVNEYFELPYPSDMLYTQNTSEIPNNVNTHEEWMANPQANLAVYTASTVIVNNNFNLFDKNSQNMLELLNHFMNMWLWIAFNLYKYDGIQELLNYLIANLQDSQNALNQVLKFKKMADLLKQLGSDPIVKQIEDIFTNDGFSYYTDWVVNKFIQHDSIAPKPDGWPLPPNDAYFKAHGNGDKAGGRPLFVETDDAVYMYDRSKGNYIKLPGFSPVGEASGKTADKARATYERIHTSFVTDDNSFKTFMSLCLNESTFNPPNYNELTTILKTYAKEYTKSPISIDELINDTINRINTSLASFYATDKLSPLIFKKESSMGFDNLKSDFTTQATAIADSLDDANRFLSNFNSKTDAQKDNYSNSLKTYLDNMKTAIQNYGLSIRQPNS